MFKQLHLNITLAKALVLMPKYQKMLKALLSNKEKLQELANIPLNENCSAVTLKKLPEKLGDHRKFLIPCGFSELKCKALADLGASINLMPLSVWKKLGLPDLIPTRMTLKLTNRAICTPDGIARDVFIPVEMFTEEQPLDYSFLQDLTSFYDDHVKEISSGSPTTHYDSSLYASLMFDLSINPFPPANRSASYEFIDELIPFISTSEYDCFLFKVEPNSRDFTKDVVEDISPTKEA
nr:reverse transcriptase domain-containing protein [Tanacetum cinerariifolium]